MAGYVSFAALGDSFTEGVGDPSADGDGCRGWADRFAELLAARQPDVRYANLAVRGKLIREVLDEQVPVAVAMRADLVSLAAGGNDLLCSRADPDALAELFEQAVVRLLAAGSTVMVFTGFDPKAFPFVRMIRGRVAVLSMHIRAIAARHGCMLADLWPMRVLTDRRFWSPDRLHLNSEGHRRVALMAADTAGLSVSEDWRQPLPAVPELDWLSARRDDLTWLSDYAIPWIGRRISGASTGDGQPPKRSVMSPVERVDGLPADIRAASATCSAPVS